MRVAENGRNDHSFEIRNSDFKNNNVTMEKLKVLVLPWTSWLVSKLLILTWVQCFLAKFDLYPVALLSHWVLFGVSMSATEGKLKPIPQLNDSDLARFRNNYAKYFDSECWPWLGKPNHDGYGTFGISKCGTFIATRIAWYIVNGEPGNKLVLHKCKQNRSCVNPTHLYLGTQSDNMFDETRDGTNPSQKGYMHSNAKFGKVDIQKIFERSYNGESSVQIAKSYNVCHSTIGRILRGERYK